MSEIHPIGELLRAGVTPTREEVDQLVELGAFVASMYGRYLHGTRGPEAMAGHVDSFSAHLSDRLGASTGTRWEDGLGIGGSLLADDWSSWWQVAARGFAPGYDLFDEAMPTLSLYADTPAAPRAAVSSGRAPRRGSLFGRRAAPARPAARTIRQVMTDGGADVRELALQWTDGALVGLEAAEALERGGLQILDQLHSVALDLSGAQPRERSLVPDASNAPGAHRVGPGPRRGPAARRPRAILDGLAIDDRTPALASALTWAESAFGASTLASAPLAMSAERVAAMTPLVTAMTSVSPGGGLGSSTLDRGVGAGKRPVFAFFDSVEGDFLNLYPETAETAETRGVAPKAAGVAGATAARPTLFPAASGIARVAERTPVTALSAPAARGAAARPVVTSLDQIARSAGSAPNAVRPYVGGIFGHQDRALAGPRTLQTSTTAATASGALPRSARLVGGRAEAAPSARRAEIATAITYTRAGLPQARVQRAGTGAPRVSVMSVPTDMTMAFRADGSGWTVPAAGADASRGVAAPADIAGVTGRALEGGRVDDALVRSRGEGGRMALAQIAAEGGRMALAQIAAEGGRIASGAPTVGLDAGATSAAQPSVARSGQAAWRLAADLGPDLPLGATFTSSELFGASLGAWAGDAMGSEPRRFETMAARAAEGVGAHPRGQRVGFGGREFTAGLDGVVWVSVEDGATPAAAGGSGMDALPLAAVPRGRRSVMMPARQALGLVAGSNLVATMSAADHGARVEAALGHEATAARPLLVSTEHTAALATYPELAAQADRNLRSGLVSRVMRSTDGASVAETTADRFAVGAERAVGGAGVPSLPRGLGGAVSGPPLLGDGPDAVRTSLGGTLVALAARWAGGGTNLMTGELRGRTADAGPHPAATRAEAMGLGPRASNLTAAAHVAGGWGALGGASLASVFGPGAYAQWDESQVLVGLGHDVAEAAVASAVAAASAPSGRQAMSLFDGSVATAVAGEARSPVSRGASRPLGAAEGQMVAPSMIAAAGRGIAAPSAESAASYDSFEAPAAALVQQAGRARSALLRPVSTAREARDVAPLMSMIEGAVARSMASVTWDDSTANTPALVRHLERTIASKGTLAQLARSWSSDPAMVEGVRRLDPVAAREVARTLRMAGFQEADLAMLRVQEDRGIDAASASEVPATGRALRRSQVGAAPVEASALERGAADRMGRNLARILSGTEGLGGSVTAGEATGGATIAAVNAQLAAVMPLLAGASLDRYFGAAAPLQLRGAADTSAGVLRDAIGELVAIAREQAAVSDGPVAAQARQSVLRRLMDASSAVETGLGAERPVVARGVDDELVSSLTARRGLAMAVDGSVLTTAAEVSAPTLGELLGRSEHALVRAAEQEREVPVGLAGGDVTMSRAGLGVRTRPGQGPGLSARTGLGQGPGVASRVASAMRLSSEGPAGARRLLRPAALAAPSRGDVARSATMVRELTRLAELEGGALGLGSVIAPEAMLGGLRSAELREAMSTVATSSWVGRALPGELATFPELVGDDATSVTWAGEPGAGRASRGGRRAALPDLVARAEARRELASRGPQAPKTGAVRPGAGPARGLFASDPVSVLLRLVGAGETGGDVRGMVARAFQQDRPVSREQRSALFSAMMRSADRREVASFFQRTGGPEFAFAWLSRVDGTRSGIDIGLGGAREEMGRAMGRPRGFATSQVAGDSPIATAGLVSPASREDRSGLRGLATHAVAGRGGATRPRHAAAQTMRRTDWRYVETGSRASTGHVDLGKLAAAIVSQSQGAQRAPMPLVAPAAKAVAQTALRASKSESMSAAPTSQGPTQRAETPKQGKADRVTLSEEAMEQLAVEMAGRVSRLFGRNKERIGVWE